MSDLQQQVKAAALLVTRARTISAFTGAGISTESGLADFRSPGGLWDRYRVVTYPEFLASRDARVEYWSMRRELIPTLLDAAPNPAHEALAALERIGKLAGVITQNIDGLHQAAGNSNVIELHGTNRSAACLNCGRRWPIEEIQPRLEGGDLDPHCPDCEGLIKPETVSFGQSMPAAAMDAAYALAAESDLMLMIGSSLEVHPAASLPPFAADNGARLIFINRSETPYDDLAQIVCRQSAGEFMTLLVEELDK
ncbi:MAG: NAD-dependent protein deacylase [Desulfuromonadales bacterium]|nr:NAD-dependent protein deacylase [Desulfuromonadales bacterium]